MSILKDAFEGILNFFNPDREEEQREFYEFFEDMEYCKREYLILQRQYAQRGYKLSDSPHIIRGNVGEHLRTDHRIPVYERANWTEEEKEQEIINLTKKINNHGLSDECIRRNKRVRDLHVIVEGGENPFAPRL